MSRNRNLTDLKNIGTTIASRLNEVGIFSEDELRLVGAAEAHLVEASFWGGCAAAGGARTGSQGEVWLFLAASRGDASKQSLGLGRGP